jgi:nitronate monooxygenase
MINRFLTEHSASAPSAYPEINHATRSLRAAARERGDPAAFNLWSGQAMKRKSAGATSASASESRSSSW